jgi:hypothetical protein
LALGFQLLDKITGLVNLVQCEHRFRHFMFLLWRSFCSRSICSTNLAAHMRAAGQRPLYGLYGTE